MFLRLVTNPININVQLQRIMTQIWLSKFINSGSQVSKEGWLWLFLSDAVRNIQYQEMFRQVNVSIAQNKYSIHSLMGHVMMASPR